MVRLTWWQPTASSGSTPRSPKGDSSRPKEHFRENRMQPLPVAMTDDLTERFVDNQCNARHMACGRKDY